MRQRAGGLVAAGVAVAAGAIVVVGCSSGDDSNAVPQTTTVATSIAPVGPFFGQCGSVSDEEVEQAFGVSHFARITRNSVGCEWDVTNSAGATVSFSWYRGSPIEREATGSGRLGRPPEWTKIGGHDAFIGRVVDSSTGQTELCEIGVKYGADFFHWSVRGSQYVAGPDPCDVGKKLAELVASRVK